MEIPDPSSISTIFIGGPTAVGKSAVALALAERVCGEIISVDSMQVYRGMDVGTAKPTAAEQQRVAHHLIDIADIFDPFDAARFVQLAGSAVRDIQSRGHVPIFCGGTGLYYKAFSEGLGEAPPGDPALRAELEATPFAELLAELERSDPVTYGRIDRQNPRRVIRALEVIRLTRKPFSAQRAAWSSASDRPKGNVFGLARTSTDLQERIHRRVDVMFSEGLIKETEGLLAQGLAQNRTAMQALGYRQVAEYLQGERPLAETVELVKIRTRQFAKRQMTWFRRQLRMNWIALGNGVTAESVVEQILKDVPWLKKRD